MSKSTKITLAGIRDIPFSSLCLSQANVRRIQAGISIEDLAEDIARRGLLQSLSVRPMRDEAGLETGLYEVPAGGRRFRALERLVQQKRLAKDAPVPCIVRDEGIAEEDSLAENVQRVGLHPMDQFRAFKTLADKGLSEDDIAARFFVPVNVVRQRLRLAIVAPDVLLAYEQGEINLEHVMAFTVNPDTERQQAVYDQLKAGRDIGTYRIKRLLTESTIDAGNKRVLFVGLDAYIDAGGAVLRDLFTEDSGGWLADPALLDRLVTEKLTREAERVRAQGWKWVETAVDFPYGHQRELDTIIPAVPMLSEADSAKLQAVVDEYNDLLEALDDQDVPETTAQRMADLEATIDALENPPSVFKAEDIEIGGAFLSVGRDGTLLVDAGYIRPEDRRPEPGKPEEYTVPDDFGGADADLTDGDGDDSGLSPDRPPLPDTPPEAEDTSIKPLPDAVHRELTAYRTLMLRDALARHPSVALTALLYKFCMDQFYSSYHADCLEVRVNCASLYPQGPDVKDCPAGQDITSRAAAWREALPDDAAELWPCLAALSDDARGQLLAHFISFGLNALYEPAAKPGHNGLSAAGIQYRLQGADRIAAAVGLDLAAAGWVPTVDNYLGRVPKPRILLAVEQGCGPQAVKRIDHLKKPEMADEAEGLLSASGWLPEPLRGPVPLPLPEPPAGAASDPSGEEVEDTAAAAEAEYAQAAE